MYELFLHRYNVLRRLLPLASLLFACLMLKKKPSVLVVASVILVVLGCVIAGKFSLFLELRILLSLMLCLPKVTCIGFLCGMPNSFTILFFPIFV